ncbi:transcriptional repressor LexA [Verrucomicrobiales bacterium]|jgi:repressor LexA|nr:transcriptional repressor LexA [Verrucomicrobiales bacterium]MDB3939857.1 transcriptional repressor LexA [Verrucomicrobiales bacterium]
MKLTARQQEILDFLHAEHRRSGIMPSTREIQEHFGFASQTAAVSHLRALEKKGVIIKKDRKARSLMFADAAEREPIADVPIYGAIPAGYSDDTTPEADGTLSVDVRSMGLDERTKAYALKVRGESMIDAHIMDGDHVVLENREPRDQDVVAALIDGETTLKRYVANGRKPYLKAENPDFPDLLPVQELMIQGVMVGLVRGATRRW